MDAPLTPPIVFMTRDDVRVCDIITEHRVLQMFNREPPENILQMLKCQ